MRVEMTEERKEDVRKWTSVKAYKTLSDKALKFLQVLRNGEEMQRTDLFRAAGWEANPINKAGFSNTDFTDYRLFASGLINMRATAVKGDWGWNGVTTYWTINEKGLAALSASY